jgi:hypothetical protein
LIPAVFSTKIPVDLYYVNYYISVQFFFTMCTEYRKTIIFVSFFKFYFHLLYCITDISTYYIIVTFYSIHKFVSVIRLIILYLLFIENKIQHRFIFSIFLYRYMVAFIPPLLDPSFQYQHYWRMFYNGKFMITRRHEYAI